MSSDYEKVMEFTKGTGQEISNGPQKMNRSEVFFLVKMMLDEIMEYFKERNEDECYFSH